MTACRNIATVVAHGVVKSAVSIDGSRSMSSGIVNFTMIQRKSSTRWPQWQ
jgi:hypothetical protein